MDPYRALAETFEPQERMRHEQALRETVHNDRTISQNALARSLPWSSRDMTIHGAVETGSYGMGGVLTYPQGGRIKQVTLYAVWSPTGTLQVRVYVEGGGDVTLSMPAGSAKATANCDIDIPPGVSVAQQIIDAGGAQHLTTSIHTTGRETT